jgi:methylated-DNA-[protein]-cysteine S-methyltransferase
MFFGIEILRWNCSGVIIARKKEEVKPPRESGLTEESRRAILYIIKEGEERKTMYVSVLDTPLGPMRLCTDDTAVLSLTVTEEKLCPAEDAVGRETARQLREYFIGCRERFDLPLRAQGTEFQQRVWRALREIPFGETRTYGQIAEAIGCPGGARAVGGAAGKNPILVCIPCHRVTAADGIGGFAAGTDVKRALLLWEGCGFRL